MDTNSGNGFYEPEDRSSNSLLSGTRAPGQSQAESPSESGFFNGGGSGSLSKHRRVKKSSGPSFNPVLSREEVYPPNDEIAGSNIDFSPSRSQELEDYQLRSYQENNYIQEEHEVNETIQSAQDAGQSSEQQPHLTSINVVRDTEHSYHENGPGVYGLGENQFKMLQRKMAKHKVTESSQASVFKIDRSISQEESQLQNFHGSQEKTRNNGPYNQNKDTQMSKRSQQLLYNQEHNTLQNFLEPQHTISLTELSDTNNNLQKIFQNKPTSSSIPARGVSETGQDLAEFLKINKAHLNDTSQDVTAFGERNQQPPLLVNLKAENQHLIHKIKLLEAENSDQKSQIRQLSTKKEQLHIKLVAKDKSIAQLRNKLKILKDDIQLVHENIDQCKRSAFYIKTEDEHLKELSEEIIVLLDDCSQKTMVKEDDKGNMSIGALTFDEEIKYLALEDVNLNSQNKKATDEIMQDIKISLEQKIASLQAVVSGQLAHAMSTGQFNQMELQPKQSQGALIKVAGYINKRVNKTITSAMAASSKNIRDSPLQTEGVEIKEEADDDDSMCNVSDEEAVPITRVKNESRRSLDNTPVVLNQILSGSTLQGIPSSVQMRGQQSVDGGQVESLKRELRIFVEKCTQVVTANHKALHESTLRSHQKDEEIIDLEWKISAANKQNELLQQENQVLTADCHNLISKNQYSSQMVSDAKESKKQYEKTISALRNELKQITTKLQLTRQEYSKIIQLHGQDQTIMNQVSEEGKHKLSQKLNQVEQQLQEEKQLVSKQATEIQALQRKINFDSAETEEKVAGITKKNEILYQQNLELKQQVSTMDQLKNDIEELRVNAQEFEKERQLLTVKITKERQKRTLFENIQKQDAGVTAQTLMDYLSYLFGKRSKIEPERFSSIHDLFQEKQIRLIELYETKINTVNKMNANMFAQLKDFLVELLRVHEGNPARLGELQKHDKIISQFQLEEESKQNIFDWICTFKDYEIRESLKQQLVQLETTLKQRDQEIIQLQLKIEDLEVMVGASDDNLSNYQSGLSSKQSRARQQNDAQEVQKQLKKDSISTQEGLFKDTLQKQMIEKEQETIALIEELKQELKMKDAEIFDLQRDLEEQHRVMLKQQISTDSASHLQIINCQATLMEELLRQQRHINSANSSRQQIQRQ